MGVIVPMTIVDISNISAPLFVTILFFLLIICPVLSLGVLRLFQGKKRAGITYLASSVVSYVVFMIVLKIFF